MYVRFYTTLTATHPSHSGFKFAEMEISGFIICPYSATLVLMMHSKRSS